VSCIAYRCFVPARLFSFSFRVSLRRRIPLFTLRCSVVSLVMFSPPVHFLACLGPGSSAFVLRHGFPFYHLPCFPPSPLFFLPFFPFLRQFLRVFSDRFVFSRVSFSSCVTHCSQTHESPSLTYPRGLRLVDFFLDSTYFCAV